MPCYRSRAYVLEVLERVGENVSHILVVDDACPEQTGQYVAEHCQDPRIEVIFHPQNSGVGGATISGFLRALELGAQYIVKLDSDGQMDPRHIDKLVRPLQDGVADYSKGNRFYDLDYLKPMPLIRLIGNAGLSFMSKFSSGYWDLMDPTNGFIAIHRSVLELLPLDKIDRRYFFESDLLFRLNIVRAVVRDVPMASIYQDARSNLSVAESLFRFFGLHLVRGCKRIFYNYFLRDFNIGSINLLLGSVLMGWGLTEGMSTYLTNNALGQATPTGTIMIVMLEIIMGFQMLLSFINYDTSHIPSSALQQTLAER